LYRYFASFATITLCVPSQQVFTIVVISLSTQSGNLWIQPRISGTEPGETWNNFQHEYTRAPKQPTVLKGIRILKKSITSVGISFPVSHEIHVIEGTMTRSKFDTSDGSQKIRGNSEW